MSASVWGIAILILLTFGLGLFLFQGRMVYHPGRRVYQDPSAAGLAFDEVTLYTDDGVQLQAWWVPCEGAEYTVLFCHGNAGTLAGRVPTAKIWHDLGCNILLFDYRGYGNSTGKPTEQGTYRDAMAAWRFLTDKKQISPDAIILHGRSLGGAVAARTAAQGQPKALIVESSFTSIENIARELYPFLPVKLILRFKYDTQQYIARTTCPLLVIHSPEDDLIRYRHGETLFREAREPKRFLEIHGDHNDGYFDSGEVYVEGLATFTGFLDKNVP